MTTADVLLRYQQKIEQLQTSLVDLQSRQAVTALLIGVVLLAGLYFGYLALVRRAMPLWFSPLSLPVAAYSLRTFSRRRLLVDSRTQLCEFYERGVARLEDRSAGEGDTGEEFLQPGHLHARDLSLFGEGSVYERLCTARTYWGRERLARYLQEPASSPEILARQAAVRELALREDLTEKVAVMRGESSPGAKDWLDAPSAELPRWLRPALGLSSIALAACAWYPAAGAIALANGLIGLVLRKRVNRVIASAAGVAGELETAREGLALLAAQQFDSPKLRELTQRAAPADEAIGALARWFDLLRHRTKDWFYLPSLLLFAGTHSAIAIEAWRMKNGAALRGWLDAWAEFETLHALALYARENPEDCWPVIDDKTAFHAAALGHPLLPRAACVRNDIALQNFYVVSGSNMAGKSTLLRSIGVAAVLAYCGAPVRAASLRLGNMRVCASMSIVDSLREGKSKFLAEVERLRDALALAASTPVLFLIDEIFSGTNSPDRRTAADAVIRTLAERGAIGALSTHDIAVTEVSRHGGTNLHMAARDGSNDPLDFDYLLKPGVTRESNALAIARLAGVPC